MICTYLTILFDICRPDASFEALKQKLESVMPASGSEQGAEASEAGTTSATTSLPRPAPAASTTAQGSVPVNPQESITANTDIRPVFAHSTSVDQSLESAQGNLFVCLFYFPCPEALFSKQLLGPLTTKPLKDWELQFVYICSLLVTHSL